MILVLGGTTEGRELCAELDRRGVANLMSLAGRTADPLLSESVRVGGFGGVDGLRRFLVENDVAAVVDDELRAKETAQDFGEAFIALARGVYGTNGERVAVKNAINHVAGSALVEEKQYQGE